MSRRWALVWCINLLLALTIVSSASVLAQTCAPAQQIGTNGEADNLLFSSGPYSLSDSSPQYAIASEAGDAVEGLHLAFDFKTGAWRQDPFGSDDPISDFTYPIVRADNDCSCKLFASLDVQSPFSGEDATLTLKARGLASPIVVKAPIEASTQYSASIDIDLASDTIVATIKGADGTTIAELSGELNTDPSNQFRSDQTIEGVRVQFGMDEDDPLHLRLVPYGWSFSNVRLDGVAGEPGADLSNGADLSKDEGKLAFLAAQMINTSDGDYALDCGPALEVLNLPAAGNGKYCVMRMGDQIVFGTFGKPSEILASYESFTPHASTLDIDTTACDGGKTRQWVECPAMDGLYTYRYADPFAGDDVLLLMSEKRISAIDPSLLDRILGFFSNLFGTASRGQNIPVQRFHHAYFAEQGARSVAATWDGQRAVLLFKGLSTDLSGVLTQDFDYSLSHQGQALVSDELNAQRPADVLHWRALTAGLRLQDAGGTPIAGDTCGNGVVGFDEQCEADTIAPSCDTFDDRLPATKSPTCTACRWDLSTCGEIATCHDDWTPPPAPSGDTACDPNGNYEVCLCREALLLAIDHQPVNFEGRPSIGTAETMFTNQGSQNIPLVCAAAKYVVDGDPSWFQGYYAWQRDHGAFMGSEYFSRIYAGGIVGANEAVLEEAKDRGDASLTDSARTWLRTFYAIETLGTLNHNVVDMEGVVAGEPKHVGSNANYHTGLTVVMPSPRALPGSFVDNTNDIMLQVAADAKPRLEVIGGKKNLGIKLPYIFAGLSTSETDTPIAQTIDAAYFGLSDSERAALNQFIQSADNFNEIKAMVGDAKPIAPITWLRTQDGVVSWFGTWEDMTGKTPDQWAGFNPNGNKPGIYAVKLHNDGTGVLLYPTEETKQSGKGGGHSARLGSQICAVHASVPGESCMDISDLMDSGITGIYEWTKENGLREISMNCKWEDIRTQGAYKIQARQGLKPEIQFVPIASPPNDECYSKVEKDTSRLDFARGPFELGADQVIYWRENAGSDGEYNAKIALTSESTGWLIDGVATTQGDKYGKGAQCWACAQGDPECLKLDLHIKLSDIPSCDSTSSSSGGSSGGGGGGGGGSSPSDIAQ